MKLKKGDLVRVITGEYKGKQSKILKVFIKKSTCIVEGVNFRIKHQRPVSPEQPGGRVKKECPIRVSNLMLVCPKCGTATRVGKKKVGDSWVRVCKKCGEMTDE